MREDLMAAWRERASRAAEWEAGQDPTPVLEALALTVALELTGDLARVGGADRDRLRKIGQLALLHVGGASLDEEGLEVMRMCAALARDGLRALSGRAIPQAREQNGREPDGREPDTRELDTRELVPPSELVRLLRGDLDGFAAGTLAMKVRRSRAARAELSMLLAVTAGDDAAGGDAAGGDAAGDGAAGDGAAGDGAAGDGAGGGQRDREGGRHTERTLSLAAAGSAAVLDPMGGRVVGTLEAMGAEAVLFEGAPRRLAVYSEEPEVLRLVAPELTTVDVRAGYWIGTVPDGVTRVQATLSAGDRSAPWTLELDPERTGGSGS